MAVSGYSRYRFLMGACVALSSSLFTGSSSSMMSHDTRTVGRWTKDKSAGVGWHLPDLVIGAPG
jgi:hypothetical protein